MSKEIINLESARILDYLSKNSHSSKLSLQLISGAFPTPLNEALNNLSQTGYISSSGEGIGQFYRIEELGRRALDRVRKRIFENHIYDRHASPIL